MARVKPNRAVQGAVAAAMFAVVACDASGGGAEPEPSDEGNDVAGGQSGTDGSGAYTCDLEHGEPAGDEVPLDEKPEFVSCSPEEAYSWLEGERTYRCPKLHTSFAVSIEPGDTARSLSAALPPDTADGEERVCYGLQLDASFQIQASDGSLAFDASFVTVDHLCDFFRIGGWGIRDLQGTQSALTFEFRRAEDGFHFMYVRVDGKPPEVCEIQVAPESMPGAGGAAGG